MKATIKQNFPTRLQRFQWGRMIRNFLDQYTMMSFSLMTFLLNISNWSIEIWKCFLSVWRTWILAGYMRHPKDGKLPWALSKTLCITVCVNCPWPCHLSTLEAMKFGLSETAIIYDRSGTVQNIKNYCNVKLLIYEKGVKVWKNYSEISAEPEKGFEDE